jgi:hypothetical protein
LFATQKVPIFSDCLHRSIFRAKVVDQSLYFGNVDNISTFSLAHGITTHKLEKSKVDICPVFDSPLIRPSLCADKHGLWVREHRKNDLCRNCSTVNRNDYIIFSPEATGAPLSDLRFALGDCLDLIWGYVKCS